MYFQGAIIGIDDEDDSTFTITVDEKTFHFQGYKQLLYYFEFKFLSIWNNLFFIKQFLFSARDTDERDKWIHALEDTILRHTHSYSFQAVSIIFYLFISNYCKIFSKMSTFMQL